MRNFKDIKIILNAIEKAAIHATLSFDDAGELQLLFDFLFCP